MLRSWLLIITCAVLLFVACWFAPRCKPGDPGISIGGMLVAGCR